MAVDLAVVEEQLATLRRAVPAARPHYALKANPHPAVITTLAAAGCGFDVASRGEIDRCLKLGVRPGDLSYGNAVKRPEDIAFAHAQGISLFSVDSRPELEKLLRRAPGSTAIVRLATEPLRARWPLSDKFGCSEEACWHLLDMALQAGHPVGVSFHVGSQQLRPAAWEDALTKVGRLARRVEATGGRLAVVNLGGGLPCRYSDGVPGIEVYGPVIRTAMVRHLVSAPSLVMMEPGRFLTADAGVLVTEVLLAVERAGTRWLHLDAGVYSGLIETWGEAIRYPVLCGRQGALVPTTLAGPTCDSADVLNPRTPYLLPRTLEAGDRLVLGHAGAYVASYASAWFNGIEPLRQEFLR